MSEKVEFHLKEKKYYSRFHFKEEKKSKGEKWKKRHRKERVKRKKSNRKAGITIVSRQSEEVAGPIHVQTQVPVVENEREQDKGPQKIPFRRQGEEVRGTMKKRRVEVITESALPLVARKRTPVRSMRQQ